MASPLDPLRARLAADVRALFAPTPGAPPFTPGDDGPIPPGSIARQVHADVTAMMIGGYASLLLQMLHPAALAGVWDHSSFRADMHGRLRNTARFIAVTTYGTRADAEASIARVRAIHDRVTGHLPDGTPYAASDPALLLFVHAAEVHCFLAAWRRYRDPLMSRRAQDDYLRDMAPVARALGATDVPETRAALDAYLRDVRPRLRFDARTRDVQRRLLTTPAATPTLAPFQLLTREAGIDLLPPWARELHNLHHRPAALPAATAAVRGAAAALGLGMRWALAPR